MIHPVSLAVDMEEQLVGTVLTYMRSAVIDTAGPVERLSLARVVYEELAAFVRGRQTYDQGAELQRTARSIDMRFKLARQAGVDVQLVEFCADATDGSRALDVGHEELGDGLAVVVCQSHEITMVADGVACSPDADVVWAEICAKLRRVHLAGFPVGLVDYVLAMEAKASNLHVV